MKTNLFQASILALVAAAAAFAQGPMQLKATVPFEFAVGNQTFPAGVYTVDAATAGSLIVKSADHHGGTITMTTGVQTIAAPPDAKLIFNRYGSQYFLTQVWPGGTSSGRQLPKAHRERELAGAAASLRAVVLASR
jgi:hypothetical protein